MTTSVLAAARQLGVGQHPLRGLLTVMWHYVRDPTGTPSVGATAVAPSAFDAQLDAIARHRTVVDWPAVADALTGRRTLPDDAALLTFDDGLVDHHRAVLPRLAARGWSAVMFAIARHPRDPLAVGHRIHVLLGDLSIAQLRTAVLEGLPPIDRARLVEAERRELATGMAPIDALKRTLQRDLSAAAGPILSRLVEERLGPEADVAEALHLSPAQIEELRTAGMTIGGHGRRHLWLDSEPPERVASEVRDSAVFLGRSTRPWPFAYPYGASSETAIRELGAAGFAAAFHATPSSSRGAFDLGRVDAESAEFGAALAGT